MACRREEKGRLAVDDKAKEKFEKAGQGAPVLKTDLLVVVDAQERYASTEPALGREHGKDRAADARRFAHNKAVRSRLKSLVRGFDGGNLAFVASGLEPFSTGLLLAESPKRANELLRGKDRMIGELADAEAKVYRKSCFRRCGIPAGPGRMRGASPIVEHIANYASSANGPSQRVVVAGFYGTRCVLCTALGIASLPESLQGKGAAGGIEVAVDVSSVGHPSFLWEKALADADPENPLELFSRAIMLDEGPERTIRKDFANSSVSLVVGL